MAVPLTVAVPAFVVTDADPTVPAVVDHDARVPPADTWVTVRTDPAAAGAACPPVFTVPGALFSSARAYVADTLIDVAVPANCAVVQWVADPTVPAEASVAVPALVANDAVPADPTVPAVVDHAAVDVFEDVRTDPAAPGAAAFWTLTDPVASSSARVTVAVPLKLPLPPVTTVAVWIALPVGIR